MIAQLVTSGAVIGLIYALIALGFQITYATSKTSNFGQGYVVMLGGMLACTLAPKIGYWTALPVVLSVCGVVGVFIERLAIAPALRRGSTGWIQATIAVGLILSGAMGVIFGRDELSLDSPLSDVPILIGGVAVLQQEILVAAVTMTATALLAVFAKSRWGKAFEAVSTDKEAAAMQGIPAHRVVIMSYIISAAMGGLAGWSVAPMTGAGPTLELMGKIGLAAAVIGSMSSARGALLSGIFIGVAESLTAFWLPSGFRPLPALLACALIIAFKPTGLFGKAKNTKV